MRKILMLILLSLGLFLCSGRVFAAPQIFEGELETTDTYWTTQHGDLRYFYDTQGFQVSEDGWYRIEILAASLDDGFNNTYLTLLDENQIRLAGDNDSGNNLLSKIEFQLSKNTNYFFSLGTLFPETTGTWKVEIAATPIPTAVLLMGSGLMGLAALRRSK